MQVDAFTTTALTGNGCAVIFDADHLTAEQMVAIARETNQAESALVMQSDVADYRVRYFTPSEEIPLAGHPTLATIQALCDSDRVRLHTDPAIITLESQAGIIQVEVSRTNTVHPLITMRQKKPAFFSSYDPADISSTFNISPDMFFDDLPIQTVSTGTKQLMIPVKSLDALRAVELNFAAYRDLKRKGDFFSPHVFCLQGVTDAGDTFARHFGTPPDLYEDPFTGSATGGMAAYLWHYNLIEQARFTAEQGHWMGRPGTAQVEIIGPRGNIEAVRVGGHAITVFRGVLTF